jgi:hypothetical protein
MATVKVARRCLLLIAPGHTQRLLLDAWRRSGLPAGAFAPFLPRLALRSWPANVL